MFGVIYLGRTQKNDDTQAHSLTLARRRRRMRESACVSDASMSKPAETRMESIPWARLLSQSTNRLIDPTNQTKSRTIPNLIRSVWLFGPPPAFCLSCMRGLAYTLRQSAFAFALVSSGGPKHQLHHHQQQRLLGLHLSSGHRRYAGGAAVAMASSSSDGGEHAVQ